MKRIVLVFGLISGAILSLMMALTVPFMDRIGFDRGEVIGYTSMILAFVLIYFGIRSYRDNVSGGTIGFWRAFSVGALIAVVASLCYMATWQVMYRTAIGPEFVERYQEHVMEKERAQGASEAELEARRAQLERFARLYDNALFNMAVTFLEPLPAGLVLALISAGILRRRGREEDPRLATPPHATATGEPGDGSTAREPLTKHM